MRFSTRSSYGLRVMIRLAEHYRSGSLSLAKIAQSEKISLGYLETVAARLKQAGLVKSTQGVKGGYVLAKSPAKISMREILLALENSLAPFYCVGPKKICRAKHCSARQVWQRLDEEIKKTLKKITLVELIKK